MVNDTANPVFVDLGVVLEDSKVTSHDKTNANYVEFAEGGLYRVDFSSDVNGNYANGLLEFVHKTEDSVQTTFRYLNLAENGIDSDTLTPSTNSTNFESKQLRTKMGKSATLTLS